MRGIIVFKGFSGRVVAAALLVLVCGAGAASAEEKEEPADPTATADAQAAADPQPASLRAALSSVEQGQTPLDETLEWFKDRDAIRAQRARALRETQVDLLVRNFFLDRHRYDDSRSQAWAMGGALGFKTGYFREILALGVTGYTTQRLIGDEDKDGTQLLEPGQHGFSVLGELYADVFLHDGLNLYAGRKRFETPFINSNDTRMIPNTFEAVVAQGRIPIADDVGINFGAGYFDKIKERDSDEFVTMSEDAGADQDRGVYAVGARFIYDELSIGVVDYYSNDIINIAYAEASNTFGLPCGLDLKLSLQYADQQSVGSDYLDDEDFSAQQFGVKGDLGVGPALFSVAFTHADGTTNMRSPWSGYPGYTSVQVEDFNRDGETAVMVRAGTGVPWVPGLSGYALWVHGDPPDAPGEFRRDEVDLNLQWDAPEDTYFKGFSARVRYAFIDQHDSSSENLHDVRVILNYNFGLGVKL